MTDSLYFPREVPLPIEPKEQDIAAPVTFESFLEDRP